MTSHRLFALVLAAALATPALAEPAPTSRIVVVTTDLDLGTATGQRLLDRRLSAAVIEACGAASRTDLAGSNAVRRCRDDTRARIAASRDQAVRLASQARPIVIAAR